MTEEDIVKSFRMIVFCVVGAIFTLMAGIFINYSHDLAEAEKKRIDRERDIRHIQSMAPKNLPQSERRKMAEEWYESTKEK